jgi:hypothetical protein
MYVISVYPNIDNGAYLQRAIVTVHNAVELLLNNNE